MTSKQSQAERDIETLCRIPGVIPESVVLAYAQHAIGRVEHPDRLLESRLSALIASYFNGAAVDMGVLIHLAECLTSATVSTWIRSADFPFSEELDDAAYSNGYDDAKHGRGVDDNMSTVSAYMEGYDYYLNAHLCSQSMSYY